MLWVFGYGSLLWNPGFQVAETRRATLHGWHRSFCMWSIHHRGTEDNPGLVLALDEVEGGACQGVALGVPPGQEDATIAYLRERELISSAYYERREEVEFQDGTRAEALTYVVDPAHVQYTGALDLETQAKVIAGATGGRGPNRDYLWNTAQHLYELGIEDKDLVWLSNRVKELTQG